MEKFWISCETAHLSHESMEFGTFENMSSHKTVNCKYEKSLFRIAIEILSAHFDTKKKKKKKILPPKCSEFNYVG